MQIWTSQEDEGMLTLDMQTDDPAETLLLAEADLVSITIHSKSSQDLHSFTTRLNPKSLNPK